MFDNTHLGSVTGVNGKNSATPHNMDPGKNLLLTPPPPPPPTEYGSRNISATTAPPPPTESIRAKLGLPSQMDVGPYAYGHTALRERRDASVTAKSAVAEASRRSRISIRPYSRRRAVVLPSRNFPSHRGVTEGSPTIKHVQFFPRLLGDCLVTERSWVRRGHVV